MPPPTATVAPQPSATPGPVVRLSFPRQRLANVLRSGLALDVGCAPSCRVTVTVARGSRTDARRTVTAGDAAARVRLRLNAAARKALKRARKVTLTLTLTAPGARKVTRRVTLAR
jgi:hypothetical protein